jgi:hypothetical protein
MTQSENHVLFFSPFVVRCRARGSFIIGFVKGVLFATRQCIVLGVWCCGLFGVVSAVLAFLLYD